MNLNLYLLRPGVGTVVRAVAWDPKGPEFKPHWDTELIYVCMCVKATARDK